MAITESTEVRLFVESVCPGMFGRAITVAGVGLLASEWETTIYWAEVELDGGAELSLALRVFPRRDGNDTFDEKARHEYAVMRSLAGKAPLPTVYGMASSAESGLGVPVIVMERILGPTLSSVYWEQGAKTSALEAFTQALVQLHGVDAAALEGVDPGFDLRDPAAYSSRWLAEMDSAIEGLSLQDLKPLAAWLRRGGPCIPCPRYSVLHGDYHFRNVMMRDTGGVAIIDWPASRIGDPLDDVAWTYVTNIEHPEVCDGFVAGYRELSGHSLDGLESYLVKGALSRIYSILASLAGPDSAPTSPELRRRKLNCRGQLLQSYALVQRLTGLEVPSIAEALALLPADPDML